MLDALGSSLDCRLYPHPRIPLTCMRCVCKVPQCQSHDFSARPDLLSVLLQIYLLNSQYPPILQNHSRTLAVPYKELRHHRTPCESIGNNYSPRGQNLKIQHLHRRRHSLQCPPTARILNIHTLTHSIMLKNASGH